MTYVYKVLTIIYYNNLDKKYLFIAEFGLLRYNIYECGIMRKRERGNLRIAICEDEPIELRVLTKKLEELFEQRETKVEIIAYQEGSQLLIDPQLSRFDVVFLDIDMPEVSGIELAERLRENSPKVVIIFVTNRDDLVYESIKYTPFRFIRKNNLEEELPETIDALQHKMSVDKFQIELPTSWETIVVNIEDIVCFTSIKHHVYAVVGKEKYQIQATMKALEATYGSLGFVRVHLSYLINYRHIFSISREGVSLDNGDRLPISRYRLIEARKRLHFFIRKW